MGNLYHWWVSLFVIAGPDGKIDLQHAVDTAGYWAQAIGTVLAVFAAIGLAAYQQVQKLVDERKAAAQLHEAVVLIAIGLSEMIGKICGGDLRNAHAAGDRSFIPQAQRLAQEFHSTLSGIPLVDLARAGVVPQVHRLRKCGLDVVQILAYADIGAPWHSQQVVIDRLEQVREHVVETRKALGA